MRANDRVGALQCSPSDVPASALCRKGQTYRSTRPEPGRGPIVAYITSRFPKLTETFVLYEMVALENEGARIEFFPLMRIRRTKMHPEADGWIGRAHFVPLLSGPILHANLRCAATRPAEYWMTWLTLLHRTWGSIRFFLGALVFFPKAVYFARCMTEAGVDHVHAHFSNHPTAVAWVIHRLTGIPYSFTPHGSDLHCDRHMLKEKVDEAAFVVAISRYNRNMIIDECGPSATARVVDIHCGVDTHDLHPLPDQAKDTQSGMPLMICCVGTLHEVKGQKYLIEACRLLSERGIMFECHFVGDGPDRQKLAKQAARGRLADRMHFRGWLTRDEVRGVLAEADVVAAPSVQARNGSREGIPVALMEAMACGVPVVASRLSGIPELVEDNVTGLLVDPRDVSGLARALDRIHGDSELRRRLGAAGRQRVVQEFDLSRNASTLMQRFLAGPSANVGRPPIDCSN